MSNQKSYKLTEILGVLGAEYVLQLVIIERQKFIDNDCDKLEYNGKDRYNERYLVIDNIFNDINYYSEKCIISFLNDVKKGAHWSYKPDDKVYVNDNERFKGKVK
jgi:hypothetical protein